MCWIYFPRPEIKFSHQQLSIISVYPNISVAEPKNLSLVPEPRQNKSGRKWETWWETHTFFAPRGSRRYILIYFNYNRFLLYGSVRKMDWLVGGGVGAGGLGGWVGGCGGGVKGCVSHDILYLLIICQMSKCQTPWLWRRFEKKRTWHNEAQIWWGQIWPHMWTSPKHLENIFYEHFVVFWWSSNLTSKLTSSYLSLIMSSFFFC